MALGGAFTYVAFAGSQQAFDNQQPSLAVCVGHADVRLLPGVGEKPRKLNGLNALGFVYDFAGDFAPAGSLAANGQFFLPSSNPALATVFSVQATSTMSIREPRGRAIRGRWRGRNLALQLAVSYVILPQLPAPGEIVAAQPYSTIQPSLSTSLIAVNRPVPALRFGSSGTSAFVGQIANDAGSATSNGSRVPGGWMPADGRLLPIARFSLGHS